ncbi:MAG: hypothetical protein P9L94_00435 [Candidatus Hinthialibacter antarcticus]|nr:hypothetical protein [Candidatus Hinthialibacter antarcticus]
MADQDAVEMNPKENVSRWLSAALIIILLLGAFSAGLFPIRGSNDPWWHLKTGQVLCEHFAEHGFTFPEHDVFTYTGAQTDWVNHEWLSQVVFYSIYSIGGGEPGGLQAVIAFKSLVLAATYFLLAFFIRRLGVDWPMACLGAMVALLAGQQHFFLRPPVFTNFFITVFMHLLMNLQQGKRAKINVVAIVVAEIVWMNLHGGGVIGIILTCFWLMQESWLCFYGWIRNAARHEAKFGLSLGVFVAVSAVSFLNPFTYHIHLLPFHVTGDAFLLLSIGEMRPPDLQHFQAFYWLLLGLLFVPLVNLRRVSIYEGLTVFFFTHQALNHMRHLPLFALFAAPTVFAALYQGRNQLRDAVRHAENTGGLQALIRNSMRAVINRRVDVLIVLLLFSWQYGTIWRANAYSLRTYLDTGYDKTRYPVGAVNFLLRNNAPGPMFNHDNFAGYLIYRLAPEHYTLFTDSRYDLWGSRYAKEEIAVFSGMGWPFGAYRDDGAWLSFKDAWTRDSLGAYANDPAFMETFSEFRAWWNSEQPYWQWVLDKYKANFIITYTHPVEYPIYRMLQEEFYGWYKVYDNHGYAIFLRDAPQNQALIEQYAMLFRDRIGAVPANE